MKNHRNSDVWLERACHLTVVGLVVTAAFLLRFDFSLPATVIPILKQAVLIAILLKLPIFDWVGFYRGLRRFVSIPDLCLVFLGNLAGSVLFAAVSMFWIGPALPRSVLVIDAERLRAPPLPVPPVPHNLPPLPQSPIGEYEAKRILGQAGATISDCYAVQGPIHPQLGIAMDMGIVAKVPSGAILTLSLSFNNDGPLGSFFRYICDNGTYKAFYDDLSDGKDNKIDVSKVDVSMDGIELEDREFIAAIREKREPNASLQQVLPCMHVLGKLEQIIDPQRKAHA
jgi:hypothetical protein